MADLASALLAGTKRKKFHELLAEQAMSTAPTGHWSGALARALQGGMAGMFERQENEEGRQANAIIADMLAGGTGGASPSMASTPPAASPAALGNALSPPPRSTGQPRIYDQNELNPMDPPSGADRDLMVRTIHAEAGNQSPEGQRAVASVIRNRAVGGNFGGDTVGGVIRAPNQFEPVNTPQGRLRMAALDPNSPQYQQIGQHVDQAYAGDDPTRGATHFFAPRAQAALGRDVPAWGRGPGQDIGDHRFFGGAQGEPQQPSGAPQVAQQPQAPPQSSGITPELRQRVTAMLAHPNPQIQAMGRQYAQQIITASMKPPDYSFHVAGDRLVAGDKHTGQARVVADATRPTYGVIGKDQFGRETYGWIDPATRRVMPNELQAQQAAQGNPAIPPAPPGVDPVIWRKEQSERAVRDAMPATDESTGRLRKEVQDLPSYKNVAQSAPVYQSMLDAAGRDNRAADLNLVYGLAKILDPGSVVRESEVGLAQAIATLPQALASQIRSQLFSNGRLDADVRRDLMREAQGRISAYHDMYGRDFEQYKGIVHRNRMNIDDVLPSFGPFDQFTPNATVPPPLPTLAEAQAERERRRRQGQGQ